MLLVIHDEGGGGFAFNSLWPEKYERMGMDHVRWMFAFEWRRFLCCILQFPFFFSLQHNHHHHHRLLLAFHVVIYSFLLYGAAYSSNPHFHGFNYARLLGAMFGAFLHSSKIKSIKAFISWESIILSQAMVFGYLCCCAMVQCVLHVRACPPLIAKPMARDVLCNYGHNFNLPQSIDAFQLPVNIVH